MKRDAYRAKVLMLLAATTLFFSGCIRELADTADELSRVKSATWNPELAVPLIKAELSAEDLLAHSANDYLEADAEDLIHLIYSDNLVSLQAKDIFEIDDQTHNFSHTLSASEVFAIQSQGTVSIQESAVIDWTVFDLELDSMIMKVGTHFAELATSIQHDVRIQVTFPDVVRNGVAYSIDLNSPYTGTSPRSVTQSNNLSNYKLDFTKGGSGINQLRLNYEITVTETNGNPLSAGQTIALNSRFLYNDYRVVWGFGATKDLILEQDTLILDLFETRARGKFTIENPTFIIRFANSFGTRIEANVQNVTAYPKNQASLALTGIPNPLPIPIPTNNQIGALLRDSILLDNNTSNIASIINLQPERMGYSVSAVMNPPGTTERNFVMDTSKLEIGFYLDLPLHGTISDFVLEEVQDVDFNSEEEINDVEYLLFRLAIKNSFPSSFGIQLYFEDDNGTILDSLFTDESYVVEPGITNSNGRVIESTSTIRDIRIDNDRIDRINSATKVRIYSIFDSPYNTGGSQDPVKIYTDNKLDVRLGVQSKLNVTSGQ